MKKVLIGISLLVTAMVAVAMTNVADVEVDNDYVVHEWGTFTSVSGSDGEQLDGLYLEEEALPGFVREIMLPKDGMAAMKFRGLGLPAEQLKGVNIKMETPVIYFYSDKEREVDVNVKFKGGVINQWYPESANDRTKRAGVKALPIADIHNLDFNKGFDDTLDWKVKILGPDSYLSYTNPQNLETPTWVNPRFTDSNMLQIGQEREKFIFYRGLARFNQPFKVTAQSSSQITLQNTGDDEISFAMVYEYSKDKKAKVWWTGSLNGKEQKLVAKKELDVDRSIHKEFLDGLVKAGLYKKEAQSMLETWRHSYFEKEGLRVFWIVPRKFTDEILPLKLKPAPKKLERVLVGRTEVLTPEFEEKLVKDFTTNKDSSPYWLSNNSIYGYPDRYFRAWQSRVKKLLKKRDHKFSFLTKITDKALTAGEFFIHKDSKKKGYMYVSELGNMQPRMTYNETSGVMEGEVTYRFNETKIVKKDNIDVPVVVGKLAVFSMKNGKLDGECKIYDTSNAKSHLLIETKIFKDGKVL